MTLEEYKVVRTQFDNDDVYYKEKERFFAEHPDCPKVKPIERLSLVMKKEFAQQILDGTKNIEVRDAESTKYCDMLYDKKMLEYMEKHLDDELMRLQIADFTSAVKPVLSIHFYTYNNSWSMDVECTYNGLVQVTADQVAGIREDFGSNEFDELLEDLDAKNVPEDCRPFFFYFVMGTVLERHNI